ncbi:hypothetical protein [Streptomyces sp. NPDC056682]|uniref:hypothetical protein n=1 Tax=Streptomyces sp. NPDC056682 TaxID=3345909 RepID=UPI0036B5E8C3
MTALTGRPLRIGTRKSPMALAQTEHVRAPLRQLDPALTTEAVPIETEADIWQGGLAQLGGKGMIVRAIDVQLQRGDIDMAIHCLKRRTRRHPPPPKAW